MSLSGNLGFVPIDEVLRLLIRSRQQGEVVVTGSGLKGRVFVGKGGVDLATTFDDNDLHRHLLNSRHVDEGALRRITNGETTLAAIAENSQDMVDLLREMAVESLYQMSHRGEEFRVREGATTAFASPKSFEVESLLEDAAEREREWGKVAEVISDLSDPIAFRRDLGDREEITIRHDAWRILSEIGAGATVAEIAERLGTTQFWAARVAARLANDELIEIGSIPDHDTVDQNHDSEWGYVAYQETKAEPVHATEPDPEPEPELEPQPVYETRYQEAAPSADPDEVDPNESWWKEPDEEPAAEADSEDAEADDDADDVEEDTEAFLEKVFSELESSDPQEEGLGLLRRRRLGSLRDFSSDS